MRWSPRPFPHDTPEDLPQYPSVFDAGMESVDIVRNAIYMVRLNLATAKYPKRVLVWIYDGCVEQGLDADRELTQSECVMLLIPHTGRRKSPWATQYSRQRQVQHSFLLDRLRSR